MAIFQKKTETKTEITPTSTPAHSVIYRNVLDLLATLDRRSHLAGLRSITGAVQFTMVNTADWIVRREDGARASDNPSLDERNTHDEFTRGQDETDEVSRLFGNEPQQTPEEKLKQYSHLYYGLVDVIRTMHPQQFERPKGIKNVLEDFVPRGATLDENLIKLLHEVEMEPGEFENAREQFKNRKTAEMADRKPRILALLEQNADCNPLIDTIEELPVQVQLRLACSAWKGVFFSRRSLVTFIAQTGNIDDLAAVKAMETDLKVLGKWCEDFELRHKEILNALIDVGVKVYGIDDARKDVKKPRQ